MNLIASANRTLAAVATIALLGASRIATTTEMTFTGVTPGPAASQTLLKRTASTAEFDFTGVVTAIAVPATLDHRTAATATFTFTGVTK